jgi:hypothetical protein
MYKSTSHNSREGFFSNDEDEEEYVPQEKTEADYMVEEKEKASAELKRVFRNWHHIEISLPAEFPEADLEDKVHVDLMSLNMGKFYLKILTGTLTALNWLLAPDWGTERREFCRARHVCF